MVVLLSKLISASQVNDMIAGLQAGIGSHGPSSSEVLFLSFACAEFVLVGCSFVWFGLVRFRLVALMLCGSLALEIARGDL